jgi:hypothetical protein
MESRCNTWLHLDHLDSSRAPISRSLLTPKCFLGSEILQELSWLLSSSLVSTTSFLILRAYTLSNQKEAEKRQSRVCPKLSDHLSRRTTASTTPMCCTHQNHPLRSDKSMPPIRQLVR